jgi:hypothetical protein
MQHPGTTIRNWLIATAFVAVVGSEGMAAAHRSNNHDNHTGHDEVAAIATCPSRPGTVLAESAAGVTQAMTVTVPRTAFLRTDERGRVTTATTNTGCPPRPGDDVWVIRADGSITSRTGINLALFRWTLDDDRPGEFRATHR